MQDTHNRGPNATRRRRWPWLLGGTLLIGALLIGLAPTIIARTSLRQHIVPLLAPDFPGRVHIGSASLGWFSSIGLHDVTVVDGQGKQLFEAAHIRSETALLSLIQDVQHLGRIQIEQPKLYVIVRADGSNVEDALAGLLRAKDEDSAGVSCAVEITDGHVEIKDSSGDRSSTISQLKLTLNYPSPGGGPLTMKLRAAVTSEQQTGELDAELSWQAPPEGAAEGFGTGSVALKAAGLPLGPIGLVLRRVMPNMDLAGLLTCDGHCQWEGAAEKRSISGGGSVALVRLDLAVPDWLDSDSLRLDSLKSTGNISLRGQRLQVDHWQVESELARLELHGAAQLDRWTSTQQDLLISRLISTLRGEDFRVTGCIDLSQLARVFPNTMRIRRGTQITSGSLQLELSSDLQAGHRHWRGQVETSDLEAISEGRRLTWEQPIQITLAAHDTNEGPVVEQLTCQSSFLTFQARGTPREATLSARADLNRLAAEFGKLVELGELQLAGKLQAEAQYRREPGGRFESSGDILIEDLQLVAPSARPWHEQRLAARFAADGSVADGGPRRIDRASVQINSGSDSLSAQLLRPVTAISVKTAWPVQLEVSGQLGTWLPRVQTWLPLDGWNIEGSVRASGEATLFPDQIEIKNTEALVSQLHATGHGLDLREPRVQIEINGRWDQVKQQLVSRMTTLASTTLSLQADEVVIQLEDRGPPRASGDLAFRIDLERLGRWWVESEQGPTLKLGGMAAGQLRLTHDHGITRADWQANVANLAVYQRPQQPRPGISAVRRAQPVGNALRPQPIWRGRKLALAGQTSYQHSANSLELERLELTSDVVRLHMAGKIDKLTSGPLADLAGHVEYDLATLTENFRDYVGRGLQLSGQQRRKFSIRGPLIASLATSHGRTPGQSTVFPDQLTAEASLGWSRANVYGLDVGQGELATKLLKNVIHFQPLDIGVSDGRVTLTPRIVLNRSPAALVVGKGPVIQNVRLSPEICQNWLKYIAPLLAETTRVDGRFSVDLAGANIPLTSPASGRASGILAIHTARVRPGPLAQQFLWIARQVEAIVKRRPPPVNFSPAAEDLLKIEQQNIEFRMADGRVYHRGFQFTSGDVTIRTHGSVGLDQSLDLVAEVPIQDKWVQRERLLAGMKGQTIQIRIRGTFSQPRIDKRAINDLAQRLVGSAAGSLLEEGINRGLERLFGPNR